MSIASEIQKLIQNLASAYTACSSKGATLPSDENFDNLPSTIATIQTGGSTTLITKTITQNGAYNAYDDNADGYSQVTVNVQGDKIPTEHYQYNKGSYARGSSEQGYACSITIDATGPETMVYDHAEMIVNGSPVEVAITTP